MARFAQEYTCLVWEVRQVFPEGGKVELRSGVLQGTRQEKAAEGSRPVGGGETLDFLRRAAGRHAKVCSKGLIR